MFWEFIAFFFFYSCSSHLYFRECFVLFCRSVLFTLSLTLVFTLEGRTAFSCRLCPHHQVPCPRPCRTQLLLLACGSPRYSFWHCLFLLMFFLFNKCSYHEISLYLLQEYRILEPKRPRECFFMGLHACTTSNPGGQYYVPSNRTAFPIVGSIEPVDPGKPCPTSATVWQRSLVRWYK